MTWADPERIYTTKATLEFKNNPKDEWLTSDLPYNHNCLWAISMSSWSNEFSSQMCKCKTSRILFFLYIFFQQSQACAGSILESQLKSKTSHSLIHKGFIGLEMWSGVRGLWKKGSERLKECLRVIFSNNLKSVACTLFISTFGLGSIPFVLILIAFLRLLKSEDLLSLFFLHSPLVNFFFFSLFPNFMHVLFALLFPSV